MKALISPQETVADGFRIAHVGTEEFPVAEPLYWADVPDDVTQDSHYYTPSRGAVVRPAEAPQADATDPLEVWRNTAEVSRFQARVALHNFGLFDAVEAAMSSADTPFLAKEAWASASLFRRVSPTVAAIASGLALTDEQLDELFKSAEKIQA